MNYKKIYDSIIKKAENENRTRGEVYYELHHILPRSMGGSESEKNLVLLTGREHFICHYLLTKFTTNLNKQKMIAAFNIMNISMVHHIRYSNSILYEANRKKLSKSLKSLTLQKGKNNSNYGTKWIKFIPSKVQMKIKSIDTLEYIEQGWIFGRDMNYTNVTKIRNLNLIKERKILKLKNFRDIHIKKYTNVYNLYLLSTFQNFSGFCRYHEINRINYGTKIRKLFNITSLEKPYAIINKLTV